MIQRHFTRTLAIVLGLLWVNTSAVMAAAPPNVVLVLTDDQGWGDLRSHGNEQLDTPHIDKMAREGARFDRFYVSPLCALTRAGLLTGRCNLRTGTAGVTRGVETMRTEEVTIAEVLKKAGYATGCFGKWHNGAHFPNHPNGQGFDEFFGFCGGHFDLYFDPLLERNGEPAPTKGYITDVLTDAAMEWMTANKERPFFAYVPYNAPHTPCQVPDRYFDKYTARGCDPKLASIYGMVENIDDNVGRLLAHLDKLDLARQTIVVFLTDNGPNSDRFNGNMKGRKGSVDEGGCRVPLIVRYPQTIRPGTFVTEPASHIDLLPTIAEFAGASVEHRYRLDGVSLTTLLSRESVRLPERILFAHSSSRFIGSKFTGAVRTRRWRFSNLSRPNRKRPWQLYDMRADPGQKTDVSKQHPQVVARLTKAYDDWYASVTATPIARPPIPVGVEGSPRDELFAPEAFFDGDVRWYNTAGYAHDWITDWDKNGESLWWDVDVARAGRYEVAIRYTCAEQMAGSTFRISYGAATLDAKITKAHNPKPVVRPDRTDAVRYIQTFTTAKLGTLSLRTGATKLTVRAVEFAGETGIDVDAIVLRRVE